MLNDKIIAESNHHVYDETEALQLSQKLGLTHFSYIMARLPKGSQLQPESSFETSYDQPWIDRYREKKYRLYDPAVARSMTSRYPIVWGQGSFLKQFRKSQQIVFHEGREFGITDGYTVPVFGPEGDIGLFTVASNCRQDLMDVVDRHSPEIEIYALRYHHNRVEALLATETHDDFALSSRERECLLWTTEGLITEEIAERINLSVSAVNYHFANVSKKLGANNKHHAAILAFVKGLL